MVINGSPDLSQLLVNVIWDISGKQPIIYLQNLSQGANLDLVSYGFYVTSPSQTVIHDGNVSQPDIEGIWSNFTLYSADPDPNLSPPPTNYIIAPWPRPWNQIEWSGAPYMLTVIAKDSQGNTWELPISQDICRPAGNVPTATNTYGLGEVAITPDCNRGQLFAENFTNTSYRGLSGTQESSQFKVNYPDDETDTPPPPFVINNFATALVPITYDSQNYEYVYNGIFLYSFGGGSYVRIRYYRKRTFPVNCNIDLCPLVCEYTKLIEKAVTGNCANATETNQLLLQINGKMNLALMAKSQPLCGIDLPALIEEIKALAGWDCDCCSPSGIQPFNSANIGDYNFQIISGGGDISGTVGVVGNNIQFTLYDKNYIFKICDDAPTSAFSVTPSLAGFTKTYCLNVNMVTLATDILNTVATNANLVNLFNSIVTIGSEDFMLIVDGSCIFQSSSSCNYTYGLANIPATTTFALLTSIKVGNVVNSINFSFNLANLPALQTYLNTLGYGTFVVTDLGSGNISIVSNTNTFDLGDLTYKIGSVSYIADFGKVCTGFLPKSANEVVQSIIYYLCGLDDNQLITSQDYTICYLTGNLEGSPPSLINEVIVPAGTKLNIFLSTLLDRNCDTVSYFAGTSNNFINGINKVGDTVKWGGALTVDTIIDQNGKTIKFNGDSNNYMQLNNDNQLILSKQGSAGSDVVNVLFNRFNVFVTQLSTNTDRAAISYYANAHNANNYRTGTGYSHISGVKVPTTNDISIPAPSNDPVRTAYVKHQYDEGTDTSSTEFYSPTNTHEGYVDDFNTLISAKEMTTTQRDAISGTYLTRNRIIFNTTTNKLQCWVPFTSTWQDLF